LRGEERNHNFVMSGDRKSATCAVCGRTAHDIRQRPIRLDEVKVRRRDVAEIMAEVAEAAAET